MNGMRRNRRCHEKMRPVSKVNGTTVCYNVIRCSYFRNLYWLWNWPRSGRTLNSHRCNPWLATSVISTLKWLNGSDRHYNGLRCQQAWCIATRICSTATRSCLSVSLLSTGYTRGYWKFKRFAVAKPKTVIGFLHKDTALLIVNCEKGCSSFTIHKRHLRDGFFDNHLWFEQAEACRLILWRIAFK